jgi:hypothetical protein
MQERHKGWAIASLVLGILGVVTVCCVGAFGAPILLLSIIAGFVTGALGLRSELRGVAIAGMVVNALALAFTLMSIAFNVWMLEEGKHPFFPDGLEGGFQFQPPVPPRRDRGAGPQSFFYDASLDEPADERERHADEERRAEPERDGEAELLAADHGRDSDLHDRVRRRGETDRGHRGRRVELARPV